MTNININFDGTPVDDGSVKLNHYAVDSACSSVINQDPQFKNKVEESIY